MDVLIFLKTIYPDNRIAVNFKENALQSNSYELQQNFKKVRKVAKKIKDEWVISPNDISLNGH